LSEVLFTFTTLYGFANLYITRLLFSIKTLLTKFVIASESTKASVYTFLPYIQSVTRILKKVFLLHAILLQNSSTTFKFFKLIRSILFSNYRSQTLPFFFERLGLQIFSMDMLFILTSSDRKSKLLLFFSNSFISCALKD